MYELIVSIWAGIAISSLIISGFFMWFLIAPEKARAWLRRRI